MGGGPFAIVEKEKFDYIKEMMRAKVPTFEVSMGESIFFRYCICFGFHVFIISSILLFFFLFALPLLHLFRVAAAITWWPLIAAPCTSGASKARHPLLWLLPFSASFWDETHRVFQTLLPKYGLG